MTRRTPTHARGLAQLAHAELAATGHDFYAPLSVVNSVIRPHYERYAG